MNQNNKEILHLAVPSIVSNVTVPLLGLVDLAIVGHMGNADYIGTVAVGSMIFNVIYWIFGFLRMGTSGMTSQAFGRKDETDILRLLIRSLAVAVLLGLAFIVCQQPVKWLALTLIHPSEQIVPLIGIYFGICIWGAPAVLGLFSLNGWFIGMQDTRVPMFVSIVQNIVNIAVSCTLVFVFGMKIEGVALGTLIAQWSGLLMALWMKGRTFRGRFLLRSVPSETFSRQAMARFFNVNRDIFLRTLFLVAVNLFFTSAGARQSTVIVAVNTLLMTFFTLFSYVMDGFAFAGEALSGKYYGAKDRKNFDSTSSRLFHWGWGLVVLYTLTYALLGKPFLHLLTNEPQVLSAASLYFHWVLLIPAAGVAAFIYDGIFVGITATRGMLVSSALAAVLFFALFFALSPRWPNHALWLALVAYLLCRGIVQWWWLRHTKRKPTFIQ